VGFFYAQSIRKDAIFIPIFKKGETMADTTTGLPTYESTGKVISSTANWMRNYKCQIYTHTVAAIQYPQFASNPATQQAMQTFTQPLASDIVIDVSQLRCTFSAQHYALYYPNICNITIYNLNAEYENAIIQEGYRLVLQAGYGDNPGEIFDGDILMCTRSKINGTEMVLNILAMDGGQFYNYGFANFTVAKGQSARAVVNNVTNNTAVPVTLGYASPALDKIMLTKGFSAHGLARETLSDMAKTINGTWFIEGGKLYIMAYADAADQLPGNLKQAIELNDKTGLLGNPQQQEQGITCKSLLNPAIQLYGFVHLSNTEITESMVDVGSLSQGISKKYSLDPEGLYRVISINHNGDTRGNTWYSDITAVTQAGLIPEMLSLNATGTMN
jgi:hypothetical protein